MADLNACAEAKNGDIITPKARMSYALNAVRGQENDNGEKRYQLSLLFPPKSDLGLLKRKMYDVALEKCKGDSEKAKAEVRKRFLDPVEKGQDPELFNGWILLRASSPSKPGFVYANGKTVPAEDLETEVYSGRWARVSLRPYWFDVKTNKGVTIGLQNVQLLDHDDSIGGRPRAEDQFEAVEGADTGSSADSVFDDEVPF